MTAVLKEVGLSPEQLGDICVGEMSCQCDVCQKNYNTPNQHILSSWWTCVQETCCSPELEPWWFGCLISSGEIIVHLRHTVWTFTGRTTIIWTGCKKHSFCKMSAQRMYLNVCRKSIIVVSVSDVCRLFSGFPESVPVYTVNRQCSSGLQALLNIAGKKSTAAAGWNSWPTFLWRFLCLCPGAIRSRTINLGLACG